MARRSKTPATTPPSALLDFTVVGRAISTQTDNRAMLRNWTASVRQAALLAVAGGGPAPGELAVAISEFSENIGPDRDNLAKPILDALQGVAYVNDRQVVHLTVEWCNINAPYVVRHGAQTVMAALGAGGEFVWIRIHQHMPRLRLIG